MTQENAEMVPYQTALAIEFELLQLKCRDTVMRAGWYPYGAGSQGAILVEELEQVFLAEEMEGWTRPSGRVWEIAGELGFMPDWCPDFGYEVG